MSNSIMHPFHLVDESPWPLVASIMGLGVTVGALQLFHFNSWSLLILSMLGMSMMMFQWWRDISREGSMIGLHVQVVELGLRWGMVLFIISEVFFFVSFFWAYFHSSLVPSVELGSSWPPMGIKCFNVFGVPLLNSIILLVSGLSVTWSHHALMSGDFDACKLSLIITITLGLYFTFLQGLEYYEASFNISDGTYGSTFFIATGFHGIHVIVGTIFLTVSVLRLNQGMLSANHHFGFEAAAWYWHFVDVVWLFLYVSIYWWGSKF